ncbi:MAG: DUF2752 domain-containing protein [Eubacterium sp.]
MNDKHKQADSSQKNYAWEIENGLYIAGLVLIAAFLIVILIIKLTNLDWQKYIMPCAMRSLFNLDCPGCGGTRALISLMKGDIFKSLYYNAFVLYAVVFGGWFMLTNTFRIITKGKIRGMRFRDCYAWVAIVILFGQFIIKNFIHIFLGIDLLGIII